MQSAARKYLIILAKVVGAFVIACIVLMPVQSEISSGFEVLVFIPIGLTVPVSVVWLVISAVKKEWKSAGYLALSVFLPVLALIAFLLTNWKGIHTG